MFLRTKESEMKSSAQGSDREAWRTLYGMRFRSYDLLNSGGTDLCQIHKLKELTTYKIRQPLRQIIDSDHCSV